MNSLYPFAIDSRYQETVEDWVWKIIESPVVRRGSRVINTRPGNVQIEADVDTDEVYARCIEELSQERGEGYLYVSEESSHPKEYGKGQRKIFISDPIDGSSIFSMLGPLSSPLTTAIMLLGYDKEILAACVGFIWEKKSFGLDRNGLYVIEKSNPKRYVQVSEQKKNVTPGEADVAAYFPTKDRLDAIYPLYGKVGNIHNDGGHPYALRVVEGKEPNSISVALEATPVPLREHIGPLMADRGDAFVRTLEGELLSLDPNPTKKQTSITATNDILGNKIIALLKNG